MKTCNSISWYQHRNSQRYIGDASTQTMAHLVLIVASDGMNMKLANKFAQIADELGHTTDLLDLAALDWPLYSNAKVNSGIEIENIADIVARLDAADAWIVIAPEYNGSLPPTLNNTIAWLSKQGGNFRALFTGRKVGLATHSGGGGNRLILAMLSQFNYLGADVLGRSLISTDSKAANPETIKAIIGGLCQ